MTEAEYQARIKELETRVWQAERYATGLEHRLKNGERSWAFIQKDVEAARAAEKNALAEAARYQRELENKCGNCEFYRFTRQIYAARRAARKKEQETKNEKE